MEIIDFLNKEIDNIRVSKIIGICGKKRSGKDTFCKTIKRYNSSFNIVSFAGPLKDGLSVVFDIPRDDFDNQDKKEIEKYNINIDNYINELSDYFQISLKEKGLVAKSIRELMQYIGTEYVQSIDKEFWAKKLISKISPGSHILISDVRFTSEANIIKQNNGIIIRINRIGTNNNDNHLSETGIDEFIPQICLNINDGDFDTMNKLAYIFAHYL